LLDLPEFELRQRFIELGIPLRIGPAEIVNATPEVVLRPVQRSISARPVPSS